MLTEFVRAAAHIAGLAGPVAEHGVSRVVQVTSRGRAAECGTNGSYYWVTADLSWPAMPEDAEIHWAPEDSYVRAKLLEDGTRPASSGNTRFDAEYLILGSGAYRLAEQLTPPVADAFLRHAEHHPAIQWLRVPELRRALHIHAEPSLQSFLRPGGVQIGTELFTPAHAGRALLAVLMLADEIEAGLHAVA